MHAEELPHTIIEPRAYLSLPGRKLIALKAFSGEYRMFARHIGSLQKESWTSLGAHTTQAVALANMHIQALSSTRARILNVPPLQLAAESAPEQLAASRLTEFS